jgi:hypothetical protein
MTASRYARGNRMDPAAVARFGCESLKKGKLIAIPGFKNRVQSVLPRFIPYRPLAKMVKGAMGSPDR